MHPIIDRLKQRKLVQWALAYVAGAGVLYSTLEGPLSLWGIDDGQLRIVQVVLVAGFFLALTLAWYHGERGEQRVSGVELLILTGILGLGAIGLRLVSGTPLPNRLSPEAESIWITAGDDHWDFALGPRDLGVVFRSRSAGGLWYRPWGEVQPLRLPGAPASPGPFWLSPNGRVLAYSDQETGQVHVVDLPDGLPVEIQAARDASLRGVDNDGSVYIRGPGALLRAVAGDRLPTVVAELEGAESAYGAVTAVGEEATLLTSAGVLGDEGSWQLLAVDLDSGERSVIGAGLNPHLTDSGHLIWQDANDNLWAAQFDLRAKQFSSDPVVLFTDVDRFWASPDGNLYLEFVEQRAWEFVWVDRVGGVQPLEAGWLFFGGGQGGGWSLSPDGRRFAYRDITLDGEDVWVMDLDSRARTRITRFPGSDRMPRWFPDGESLLFLSDRNDDGSFEVWTRAANGTGEPELLASPPQRIAKAMWGPDAEYLIVRTEGGDVALGAADILSVDLSGTEPSPMVADPATEEATPAVSPDGRWLAYTTLETGRSEVYLRPLPDLNRARHVVSVGGGRTPRWSSDGSELFYVSGQLARTGLQMVAVEITTDAETPVGDQEMLFDIPRDFVTAAYRDFYSVTPDSERFLMARLVSQPGGTRLAVVRGLPARLARLSSN